MPPTDDTTDLGELDELEDRDESDEATEPTVPPLALDIDGTLTTPAHTIDPRVFEVLPEWPAPVVIATGKAFPYPVALCHFAGIPERVIAENGGVVCVDEHVSYEGDPERVREAATAFAERGGDLGWGAADTVNRWRETEFAARRTADEATLRALADEFDLNFIDSQYAYHLTSQGVSKGRALGTVGEVLDIDPTEFVAIGDSENDAELFGVVGESYALSNADDTAKEAADTVLDVGFMDGTLSVLNDLLDRA
ncbi:HAD hydrolase family protein [Halorarum halophilum]|uniref:Phosphoglycolate phosphatase n=1 Tax=Halorarum halophilum TaxID=2743090 RepID=A0A7D5KLY4_9EURY|nr:HAD hydrolase family protein [Halobaculum halophilum]QLG27242.1 HAD hydrolase family protein [Halobaculum halophilum]